MTSGLLGLALATALGGAVPLWLTFEIANPATVGGHRILHLEDVLGPDKRRDVPSLPSATAALLFSVRPEDCGAEGLCADVARWTAAARQAGGLVVAVVLAGQERAPSVRSRMATIAHPFPVAVDGHGVVRALAGVRQPGTFVVIDSKGATRRWTPKAGRARVTARGLEEIRAAFINAAEPRGG